MGKLVRYQAGSSQVENIVNQQQGAGVEPGPVAGQQSQQLGV